MSALSLELVNAPLEAVPAELAVVAFFADDRPLTGGAGRADWRLCGLLSQLLIAGRLKGEPGEAALIPSQGGMTAPLVLALGLGARGGLQPDTLERYAGEALDRARKLRRGLVALGWPDRLAFTADEQVSALLAGIAAARALGPGVERVRLVASMADTPSVAEVLRARAEGLRPDIQVLLPPLPTRDPRPGGPLRSPLSAPPRQSGSSNGPAGRF
jgi:hypothetical protein